MQKGQDHKRSAIFASINTERAYQEIQQVEKKWKHGGWPSVEAEILLVLHYAEKLREAWVNESGDDAALDVMRKIAGIVVRCGENHGLPPRKLH